MSIRVENPFQFNKLHNLLAHSSGVTRRSTAEIIWPRFFFERKYLFKLIELGSHINQGATLLEKDTSGQ